MFVGRVAVRGERKELSVDVGGTKANGVEILMFMQGSRAYWLVYCAHNYSYNTSTLYSVILLWVCLKPDTTFLYLTLGSSKTHIVKCAGAQELIVIVMSALELKLTIVV